MTIMKILHAGLAALAIVSTPARTQQPAAQLQSTAPEPATSPSQAATPAPPATSPSSRLGGAPTVQLTFELVDRNNDGFITRDEAARYPSLANNFSTLDRNRSNSLDRSEFVSFSR
jgi:hypothetical protein